MFNSFFRPASNLFESFSDILPYLLLFGLPTLALLFFFISLFRFLSARKPKNGQIPLSPDKLKTRMILLIISAVIAGTMLSVIIGFAVLIYLAVAFM